jgi:tyrosyl-tRNA synthetase
MQADICQLGMDQRKVNVLAREYCTDIKRKNKPIILSHRILVSTISRCWIMFKFYVI